MFLLVNQFECCAHTRLTKDDTDGSTVFATPELVDTALGPGVDEAGLCGSGPNGQSVSEHERKRNRKRKRKHSKHWHVQH